MLPVDDDSDDRDRLQVGRSRSFQLLLDRSRQSIAAGRGLSEEAFWKAVLARGGDPGKSEARRTSDRL
jgi:hypothetical protein